MTPAQRKRLRAIRIRKRLKARRLRLIAMEVNPKAYIKCGFCTMILLYNADLSFQILGVAHDSMSPRMCGICMNQMEKPVEKWLAQDWMNAHEMAFIWNAVRKERKVDAEIVDAISGLMERSLDHYHAIHVRRQATPELFDETWYRNAGQAYAYAAKLILLIDLWQNSEGIKEIRKWLRLMPFIISRPARMRLNLKKKEKPHDGGQITTLQHKRVNGTEILTSDGGGTGQRRRTRALCSGTNGSDHERFGPETGRVSRQKGAIR